MTNYDNLYIYTVVLKKVGHRFYCTATQKHDQLPELVIVGHAVGHMSNSLIFLYFVYVYD